MYVLRQNTHNRDKSPSDYRFPFPAKRLLTFDNDDWHNLRLMLVPLRYTTERYRLQNLTFTSGKREKA